MRRDTSVDQSQGVEVSLVPHEERDRLLALFRRDVRAAVRSAVTTHVLHRDERRTQAAGLLTQLVHGLHRTATSESERLWWRRAIVRRRRARLAAGMR